ncbi:MAG: translation initiation factor IF-2 [Desulfovibrionaceae bacterium]|nr:translation initiation factor IF-2 [Desulfovibrionaceae bacterium]
MDEKIKVRDLAADLGVSTKDLTRVLRELEVEVKSSASTVSPEDAAKAKARLQPEASAEVMRKEIQPGLIVRRRRVRSDTEAQAPAEAAPPASPAPAEAAAERAEDTPHTGAEQSAALPDSEQGSPGDLSAGARPAPAASDKARPVEGEKKPRRKKAPLETPPARVVRPVASAAPTPPPPAAESPDTPAPAPVAPEVPEARVSAPETPAAAAEAPAKPAEAAPGPAPKTEARVRADRPRRAPAASAEPDGSSQPSLLPPVSESRRPRDDGEEGERPRRRPQDGLSPQVRVISRPDPSQARVLERPAPSDARGDDRRQGYRSGTPRPGGASRSGGPRPGGARTAGAGFPPPFGQQPPMEGADQSRKKRNKGRRAMDFSLGSGADFTRHHEDDEGMVRTRSRKPKKQAAAPQSTQPMKAAKRKIRVEEAIRVADMAHQMGVKSGEIIKVLFGLGVMATINNSLDIDTATLVASEFGYEVEKVGFSEEAFLPPAESDSPEQLRPRPPVVTIMGHVDHGKTSLLDAIRKTSVTSGEAGGITQHIGAYHVKTKRGDIVFLDTPGHEAFTAMRARGAQVTDLVVLVVAADDGVMEQTREAINHSRAAGVPILVAVNKIDKEGANPDRVLRELAELGLQAESWGGDTVVGFVSAKTGQGLDELLELIALQAEILELKANPGKPARGHVVEAKLDKGRGPVATVLIQGGTIHQGDVFVCGVFAGRVRALFNDQGRKIKEAGPSMPVEVQGFEGVPEAGEEFICLADEKTARRIAEARAVKQRERELAKESRVTLETFLARRADDAEALVLNLVLKADVQGSVEAIAESLRKLSTDKVRIDIIHGGAGAISESDVMLAAASSAIIIGFNVRPTAKVKDVAEQEGVDIRFYDIIYKLVDEIKSAMAGMLAPVSREVYLGQAEVRDTFSLPKIGVIAGCFVTDGKMTRSAGVRLLRDGVVVYTGKTASLKRFKDDAKEVPKGMECGMGLENFHDIKVGDIIEAFETVEEAATL